MKMHRLLYAALLASVLVTVAACGDSKPPDDNPDGGLPDGGVVYPPPLPTDPNDPNNATKDTDCDGLSDKVEFETDRGGGRKTDPGVADTDHDGLPDGLELGIDTPVTGTTCTLTKDESLILKTDPTNPDSDGDGLKDGTEDANHNGKWDSNETNPLLKDTDCDGLIDGPTSGATKGEDQNANGTKDTGETDPRQADTDGDGILDGIELGVTANPDPTTCTGFKPDTDPNSTTDATNADSDGDGVSDGAEDTNQNGQVDNGELDPKNGGDTSGPVGQVCTANNLRPVTFKSESGADLKLALPPTFADADVTQIKSGSDVKGLVGYDSTNKVGFLVYRRAAPTNATDALGDEEALQPTISSKGALSNRTAQRFRTWDDNDAVQAFYDQAGASTDLKTRVNELVDALVPGSTGRLGSPAAGVTGNFRLQSLYVHRSQQSVVVLIAITAQSAAQPAMFSARDLSDGSALAQFGEPTSVQCERFQLTTSKVDFLFVVDDSGSMATSQTSLATAADAAVAALNNTSLDWRMAMVSTNYHYQDSSNGNQNYGKLRKFTRNVNNVKAWLTQNSVCQTNGSTSACSGVPTTPLPATCSTSDTSQGSNNGCWVSTSGTGAEGLLGAARKAVQDITPGTDPSQAEDPVKVRKDAGIVVVFLGDADDQTKNATTSVGNCGSGGTVDKAGSECENVQNFVNFFGDVASTTAPTNPTGKLITVHGIVCPAGSACGCTNGTCDFSNGQREFNIQPANGKQRHRTVVEASGGVLGSIIDQSSITASVNAIISNAIGNAGYKTLKPPIGASIKVAVDNVSNATSCNKDDIPRSTVNGFDFDGRARTISLFGACRPQSQTAQAAVSYRYWINSVSDPNGGVPCQDDPNYSPTEPDHCAGPQLGCNTAGNQCVCNPNCGNSCGAGTQCDMTTCTCEVIIG